MGKSVKTSKRCFKQSENYLKLSKIDTNNDENGYGATGRAPLLGCLDRFLIVLGRIRRSMLESFFNQKSFIASYVFKVSGAFQASNHSMIFKICFR